MREPRERALRHRAPAVADGEGRACARPVLARASRRFDRWPPCSSDSVGGPVLKTLSLAVTLWRTHLGRNAQDPCELCFATVVADPTQELAMAVAVLSPSVEVLIGQALDYDFVKVHLRMPTGPRDGISASRSGCSRNGSPRTCTGDHEEPVPIADRRSCAAVCGCGRQPGCGLNRSAMDKRSYGSGRLFVRADGKGRERWYGSWWAGTTRVQRKVGPKRAPGTTIGLTRIQAERELRKRIDHDLVLAAGERKTLAEAGRLYVDHLEHVMDRKRSTIHYYGGYLSRRGPR